MVEPAADEAAEAAAEEAAAEAEDLAEATAELAEAAAELAAEAAAELAGAAVEVAGAAELAAQLAGGLMEMVTPLDWQKLTRVEAPLVWSAQEQLAVHLVTAGTKPWFLQWQAKSVREQPSVEAEVRRQF